MDKEKLLLGYFIIGLVVGAYSLTDVFARSRSIMDYVVIVTGWPIYLLRQI